LREELPRILSQTGATLVYATTEPLEALQLGGNTATLWQGRLVQFGPSSEVYHRPSRIESARVFSDPPLTEVPIVKAGAEVRFGSAYTMPALGTLARIADGNYTVAFRADIVSLRTAWPQSLTFAGEISVAEISGSESFVHVTSPLGTFVCVEAGVSALQPGQRVDMHVDATRVFVFDSTGALVVVDPEQ
jgi:glycerol transport system ATP-binding protein